MKPVKVSLDQQNHPASALTSDSKQAITPVLDSEELVTTALRVAIEQRAHDVLGLEFGASSSVADYFVIASGTSARHVQGIADKIRSELNKSGERPAHESGYESAEWIILDYCSVVVHVFYEPTRHFFALEELFRDVPRVRLAPELDREANKFRTGMVS